MLNRCIHKDNLGGLENMGTPDERHLGKQALIESGAIFALENLQKGLKNDNMH